MPVLRVLRTAPEAEVAGALLDEPDWGVLAGGDELDEPGAELPQAAMPAAAAAASKGAAQYRFLRMFKSPFFGLTPSLTD
jgi:hypothetical protein